MDPQTRLLLAQDLRRDEGVRKKPYRDSLGIWTVGVGHNLESGPILSDAAVQQILLDDLDATLQFLDLHCPWWLSQDPIRQRVLANMAFNLGPHLLEFHQTLSAFQAGNFALAAAGMRASVWAQQVGARADRLALMTESGLPLPT
jgi:lysozyme